MLFKEYKSRISLKEEILKVIYMDYTQAKNKIQSLFREGGTAYEKVLKEEYKQMYYAVLSHLDTGNAEWRARSRDSRRIHHDHCRTLEVDNHYM